MEAQSSMVLSKQAFTVSYLSILIRAGSHNLPWCIATHWVPDVQKDHFHFTEWSFAACHTHCHRQHYLQSKSNIGVGAGKFLGVRWYFARIFPNLPEKFLCKIMKTVFWYDLHKRSSRVFVCSCKCWAPFFCRIFRDFSRICDKPNIFGVRLHPLHLRLLHHCNQRMSGLQDAIILSWLKLAFCNLESSRIISCHLHLNCTQLLHCHT